jgi:uncharacterized membrane protein
MHLRAAGWAKGSGRVPGFHGILSFHAVIFVVTMLSEVILSASICQGSSGSSCLSESGLVEILIGFLYLCGRLRDTL